jgi:uncharacterized protein YegL
MRTRTSYILACITLCLSFGASPLRPLYGEDALDKEYADQTGTAITIIFDNSGSMEGRKLTEAKQAFRWWLDKAPESYTWSLIDFDEQGRIEVPFAPLAGRKVALAVNALTARTNTPIVRSLNLAMKQIRARRAKVSPYQRHVVLLFTDGAENEDRGGTEAVLRTIRAMRAASVEVVGIGYHGDGDYLAQAATRFYAADSEKALRTGLAQVDAEVNLGGELNVTPEDLKAMEVLPVATAKTIHTTDVEAASPGTDGSANTPSLGSTGPAINPNPPLTVIEGVFGVFCPIFMFVGIIWAILNAAFNRASR